MLNQLPVLCIQILKPWSVALLDPQGINMAAYETTVLIQVGGAMVKAIVPMVVMRKIAPRPRIIE